MTESCDTGVLLMPMATNGTEKQSLHPITGHGGSEKGNRHEAKRSKRSSTSDNKGSRRLAEGLCFNDETDNQERRVDDDHDSAKQESKPGSAKDLCGSSGEKSSQAAKIKTRSRSGATRRADGRWQATLEYGKTSEGKRIRKAFYGRTKADALAKRDRAKSAIILGVVDLDDATTLQEFAEVFIRDIAPLTCRGTTVVGYQDLINRQINPRLGHMRLQAIRAAHIDNLMTQMKQSGLSVNTLKAARRVLSNIFANAERSDLISSNPVRRTKVPKLMDGDKYRKPVPYTKEEISNLLELIPSSQYGTLWKFLLWTGMRRGEALALNWNDLVEENGEWSAKVSKQLKEARLISKDGVSSVSREIARPKTKSGIREVPLDQSMYEELQALRRKMTFAGNWVRDDDFIFQTASGEPYFPSNVTKAWAAFLRKNGLRHIPLHGLRHTFATVALSEGAPLESVSEILGHSSIQITKDIYASKVPGSSRRAMSAIGNIMKQNKLYEGGKGVKWLDRK